MASTVFPYFLCLETTFDPTKDAANIARHGVSLGFGALVLQDPHQIAKQDTRKDYGEARFATYGCIEGRVNFAVWTIRDGSRRFISVRKANERERRRYHQVQNQG